MTPTWLARLCAGRLHYAWVVLGLVFVSMLAGVSVRAAPGVMIGPLRRAFGLGGQHDLGSNLGQHHADGFDRAVHGRADAKPWPEAHDALALLVRWRHRAVDCL